MSSLLFSFCSQMRMADWVASCWIFMDFHQKLTQIGDWLRSFQWINYHPWALEVPPKKAVETAQGCHGNLEEAWLSKTELNESPKNTCNISIFLEIFSVPCLIADPNWTQSSQKKRASFARLDLADLPWLLVPGTQSQANQHNQRESEHNDFDFALPC